MVKVCLLSVYFFLVAAPVWAQQAVVFEMRWDPSASADVRAYAACMRPDPFPADLAGKDYLTGCPLVLRSNDIATTMYGVLPAAKVGTWYVRLVAIDDAGNVSDWSNEATVVISAPVTPETPGSVTIFNLFFGRKVPIP